jgi:hypothetical protein
MPDLAKGRAIARIFAGNSPAKILGASELLKYEQLPD